MDIKNQDYSKLKGKTITIANNISLIRQKCHDINTHKGEVEENVNRRTVEVSVTCKPFRVINTTLLGSHGSCEDKRN